MFFLEIGAFRSGQAIPRFEARASDRRSTQQTTASPHSLLDVLTTTSLSYVYGDEPTVATNRFLRHRRLSGRHRKDTWPC